MSEELMFKEHETMEFRKLRCLLSLYQQLSVVVMDEDIYFTGTLGDFIHKYGDKFNDFFAYDITSHDDVLFFEMISSL